MHKGVSLRVLSQSTKGHIQFRHNALLCISIVFNLFQVPREIENNAYVKFWREKRSNMVHLKVVYS